MSKESIAPKVVRQYQSLSEKGNSFKQLHMHEQRAVNREVDLQVLGHQESNAYKIWAADQNNVKLLSSALQETYSSKPEKVKELVIRDNRANYTNAIRHGADSYDKNNRIKAIAQRIDSEYDFEKSLVNNTLSAAIGNQH